MSRYRRLLAGIGSGVMIAIGVVSLLIGAVGGNRPTEIFIPWGIAYLIGGALIAFMARSF